tara:strand:+ start:142 stop:591 length:450 start_codon:yes stop_codon:yes gene_type:complete
LLQIKINQINTDLKEAMLSKDNTTRDTLRMLKSEIKRHEIDNRIEADDMIVITILKKMIKQRKDSIEQFDKGGRSDLSEIEKNELLVLEKYMPEMMSEEAISELVSKTISELGAEGPQDMGKVMGQLKSSVGDAADMGVVSKIVKEKLI